jgi:hypothetical protein
MSFTAGPHPERTDRVGTAAATASEGDALRTTTRRIAPDAVVASVVGLALMLLGLIVVVRGFTGELVDPVVEVLGFTHTTMLGLIEVTLGACLLASGTTASRDSGIFFGMVLGIGAFIGAVQETSVRSSLALEPSLAWLAVLAAVAVVCSAVLLPRFIHSTTSHREW